MERSGDGQDDFERHVIVTAPMTSHGPFHDRMPVPARRRDHDAWLTGKAARNSYGRANAFAHVAVSKRVNVSGRGTMTRAC